MKIGSTLAVAALAVAGIGRAEGSALGPGAPSGLSMSQKQTVVNSGQQVQTNVTAYTFTPVITSIITQTFSGSGALRDRADSGALDLTQRGVAAAADGGLPMQLWLDAAGGNSKNSLATGGYSIGNYGTQAGAQIELDPSIVIGLGASWQNTSGTLNGGFSSRSTTFGLSPYAGWQATEHWNLSLLAGGSFGQNRLSNAGFGYAAKYGSSQWDVVGAVNGSYEFGGLRWAPTASLLYNAQHSRAFTDNAGAKTAASTAYLTRGSAGGAVSLPLTGWEPYIRASAEHDFKVPTGAAANGDSGGTIGAGTTVTISDAVWITVDGGYNSLGRTGLSLWSADARVNLRF